MKRVLTWLVVGLVGLGALLLGVAFLLPNTVRVERSAVVARPACTLSAVLDGFGQYQQWAPWAQQDPETKYTFEGPVHGVGAKMTWASSKLGNGTQEVIAVDPCEKVDLTLDFDGRPSKAGFVLAPVEGGTNVTWWLSADLGANPVARYLGTMFDRMIGPDYERGLANLQAYAERLPAADFAGLEVEQVVVAPIDVALLTTTAAKDGMAVGMAQSGAIATIRETIGPLGLTAAGPTRVAYRSEGPGFALEVMIPVVGTPSGPLADGPVKLMPAFTGPALKTVHRGGYESKDATWEKLEAWREAMGIAKSGAPAFEEYLSDPATTSASDLQTALFLPVAPPSR